MDVLLVLVKLLQEIKSTNFRSMDRIRSTNKSGKVLRVYEYQETITPLAWRAEAMEQYCQSLVKAGAVENFLVGTIIREDYSQCQK